MDTILVDIFSQIVGNYIDIDKKTLHKNFLSQQTTFFNVSFRKNTLLPISIPFVIQDGSINEMKVSFSLSNRSIIVNVKGVNVLCSTDIKEETNEQIQQKKVDQLNAFELFTSKNGSSIKKQLALKFLKSLVVIIDDINVRYIDSGKVLRMHIDNITYDAFSSKDNSNTSKKAIISNIGLYGEFDDSGSIGKKNNQTNMLMIQEMICYIDIKQMNTYEQLCITINAPFLTGELKKETYEVVLQFFERLGTLGSVKKKQIAPLRKDIIENTRTIYTYMYNEKRNCNNEFDEELKNYENEMEIEEIIYLRKSALQQNTTNVDDIDYYKNTPEDSDEVMRICFLIENCNVYVMKNEDNVSLLALIGKIEMNLQVFGKGFHINLSIDSFALSDHQGKFKEVVKKVFRNDDIEQPLVSMIVEQVDEKQTTVLITILNTQIVITKEFMKTLGGFTKYHNNLEMSHIVKFIQEQAQVLINSTSKHWRDIVESSNLSLTLNIVEPTIFIPVSSNQTETPCLKLSFEKCVVFPTDTKLTYKYTISNIHVTFLSKFITTKEAQEIDVVKDISLDGQIIFENNSPIQIDSTLNSFNYLISKTKFSVFHKFIRQFTNEWSSSNDLKIQSIHPFLLMIKKWIQRVLSKSNSSFIFNTYFKTVDLSISPLEETKGNEFLNVHMENLFLGVVLLPSLFTLKYNLDQLQVYDCFNITKLPPLLSLNKKKSTACEGTLSIDDNTIPMIKVFLQLDDIGIIIEPTIVGELLKTAVAVISFFNRNKNDKLLETKQDVNNIESKQDNTIDNSTQTPFGVQLQLEIIIFKTDITLMQNPSTKVSIISIGGVKTTFTFDNTLTTQVSINKAIMWSKDSKTPIFSYKGSSPIQLSYSKMIQHIKTFDVHVRKVGLEMEKAELIILPNFIQQIVDIITSKSILQVIQPKKAKKVFNTVKRFSRRISSRDMVHSMFQHTTKTNLIHKEHSIIIPTISMLNFAISMQEDNEFVTTTFQTITINTLQNYNNDVITQSILLDFKDCKIYSSHIHTNKPIFSGQGASIEIKRYLFAQEVLEQTTEIDCSIQEPIQITLQTTEFKFLVNFSQHLKTKIEQKQWSQIKNIVTNYFSLKVSPSQQEFLYKHKKFNTHINHIVFVLCDQNELAHLDINDINLQLNIHKKEESLNTLFSIGNISLTTAENTQNLYSNILQTPKDQKFFSIQIKKKLLQPTTIDIVVSSLQIINNPDIFITILPYITSLLPNKRFKTHQYIKKNEASSVNIKKIVCLLTNEKVIKETNKDVKILRCLKGSEIFEKLMVIGFSEYTTEYLCDELISLGILSGQYPFKHTEKYDILSAYKNDKQSILLPSFETKHSKILNSKHESKEKLMISFTYNKLSLLTLLNPNSLETPYIMCQCSGRVVYKQCYDDSFFFSFQTTNCELLSCISSNGMLTHSSHPINKEFKLTVSCIGVTENNHISIQTSCDIHCGIFNVSCTDLRTIYEFINKLNDIKKDIVNSNSLDTNVVDYEQYLYFPQIRFKKDIYSTTNINIDTSCVIVYHPTNKTPLLKIQINNNQSKLNQYNDDIVFSVLPELSVSYFNENFGEYEEVIHNIQTFLIFRLAIDLHNNTPEICKTLHIRFNQLKNDFTISHEMLSSLILFYQKFKTIKNIQHNKNSNNIYVIDQVSAKTLQTGKDDFVLKVWIEDQPVVQLNPNSLTPLHYNSTTTPTHFFISINNVTFKVPLTTTIPQKHILAQTCCIFSKMKYQQDGSKIITFTTQYLFKNFFHVPITINLNLGGKSKKSTMFVLDTFETRSIPLSFEGCDIFVEINKFKCIFSMKELLSYNQNTPILIPFINEKYKCMRIIKDVYLYNGIYENIEISLMESLVIANGLPRTINIAYRINKNMITNSLLSGETIHIDYSLPSFTFEGEGSTIQIPVHTEIKNEVQRFKTNNGCLQLYWTSDRCWIGSEYIVYNKTSESIFFINKSDKWRIHVQPGGSGSAVSLNNKFIKIEINNGTTHSIKQLTTGDLCIIGNKTYYIHLEVIPHQHFPKTSVVTITYSYYIINTTLFDLYMKYGDNIIPLKSPRLALLSFDPIPLILPTINKHKKSTTYPEFQLGFNKNGPFSPVFQVSVGTTYNTCLQCSQQGDYFYLYMNVRPYNNGGCIVLENETLDNCKVLIVNDTNEITSCWWSTETKGNTILIMPKTSISVSNPNRSHTSEITLSALFLSGESTTFPVNKMKAFPIITYGKQQIFIYVYIINGITTLTLTSNEEKAYSECPLFNSQANDCKLVITDFIFEIPSFSIDLIGKDRMELCYIDVEQMNITAQFGKSLGNILLNINSIQIDADLKQIKDGVFLCIKNTKYPSIVLKLSTIKSNHPQRQFCFPSALFCVQPIILSIESTFLKKCVNFYSTLPFSSEKKPVSHSQILTSECLNSTIKPLQFMYYIQQLTISNLSFILNVSFESKHISIPYHIKNGKLLDAFQTLSPTLIIKNGEFCLNEQSTTYLLGIKQIKQFIIDQFIHRFSYEMISMFVHPKLSSLHQTQKLPKRIRKPLPYNPEYPLQKYNHQSAYLADDLKMKGYPYYINHLTDGLMTWVLTNQYFLVVDSKISPFRYNSVTLFKDTLEVEVSELASSFRLNKNKCSLVHIKMFIENASKLMTVM